MVQSATCRATSAFLTASGACYYWGCVPYAVSRRDAGAARGDEEESTPPTKQQLSAMILQLCEGVKE
eukprot:SAG25_NODE_4985_length_720_cov_1.132045_1_plen_66_part_10